MRERPTDRNICELWWKYLQRTNTFDLYREFCEWAEKNNIELSGSNVLILLQGKNMPTATGKILIPKKFQVKKGRANFLDLYLTFQGLKEPSFEEWWKSYESMTQRFSKEIPPIQDYTSMIEKDMDRCIAGFKQRNGRLPTLEEFRVVFVKEMRASQLFLRLSVRHGGPEKIEDLKKIFGSRVREERRKLRFSGRQPYIPLRDTTSRINYDELKRYLDVYVRKVEEGMSMKEIIEEIASTKQKEDQDIDILLRKFGRDLEKARKIIKNVERGYFPGKY